MKIIMVVLLSFCFTFPVAAQMEDKSPCTGACPTVGWDSLAAMIHYPELARRAGLQGAADVQFYVDSLGSIKDSIIIKSNADIFAQIVRGAIGHMRWNPAVFNGKPVGSTLSFPIYFKIRGDFDGKSIIIETTPAILKSIN